MKRIRYIYVLFFFCSLCKISFGVDTDTLTISIIGHYDNARSLFDLNEVPAKKRSISTDEARTAGEHQLELAQKSDNKRALGDALNNMGLVYLRLNKPGKSLEYFNNALMTKKDLKDQ